jgi:tRNA-dihydrouridine synthase 1
VLCSGIAKRGHYGSFLLEESQLLHDIVSTLHQHLSVPVTCKIRRLATDEATIALVKMLEEAGAALITIHGRSRHQLKDKVGACDFDLIRLVKQNARVPVFANGGIFTADDVARCLAHTGADGVMSSEALLCNPTLFSGRRKDSRLVAREYLAIVAELEAQKVATDQASIRAHLFKMLYQHICLPRNHDLRDELAHCDPQSFGEVVQRVCARFEGMDDAAVQAELDTVPLWYHRHNKTSAQLAAAAAKEAARIAEREAALADPDRAVDDGLCGGFSMFDDDDAACGAEGCGGGQQQQQQEA